MLPDKYVKENGYIYGHRCYYRGNGNWIHEYFIFNNADKAIAWKRENDSYGYKRELLSKTRMKSLGVKFDEKGRIVA